MLPADPTSAVQRENKIIHKSISHAFKEPPSHSVAKKINKNKNEKKNSTVVMLKPLTSLLNCYLNIECQKAILIFLTLRFPHLVQWPLGL